MKKIILLFALALCAVACNSVEKNVEKTADGFLNAYYSMEYDKAASFCTPELAPKVLSSGDDLKDINPEVVAKIKEITLAISYVIDSVSVDSEAEMAKVYYSIKIPEVDRTVKKELKLKIEGSSAKVDVI